MSHFYKGEHFRNNQNSWNFMNKGMMIGYSPFLGNGGGLVFQKWRKNRTYFLIMVFFYEVSLGSMQLICWT